MRNFSHFGASLAVLLWAGAAHADAAGAIPAPPPAFAKGASIPAPDGRWDFASWDREHNRLIVAHGSDVLVIDPAAATPVRAIGALAGAHAALAIPGTDTILVSSGHDDTVRILEASSGIEKAKIAVTGDPDATILSADNHTAYVMGGDSGSISVIDLVHGVETARIAVKPGLEVPVLVHPGLLAVNNEQLSEIDLVDLVAGKASGSVALTGCEGPTGLALAPETGLALSACANGQAALVDMAARRLVKLIPIGQGPDTAIWDAAHSRFLVPCGKSGTLSVISLDPGGATAIATVATATSARTAAMDPATGRVYLPAASFQPAAAGQRPSMQAGSFRIVVLTPIE